MLTRSCRLVASLFALALSIAIAGTALAHGPQITAEVVCGSETGVATINFTATSWILESPGGENPQVDILFNNIKVAEGAFVPPDFSFSGSLPAPAGDSVIVTAVTSGTWADGVAGGQSASVVVSIPSDVCGTPTPGTGRFTGGGFVKVDGVKITRGLTIHCDLLLSNNLEINWGNGKKFHMTEHLETIECSDSPDIDQTPPAAPLDTLIGIGTGKYNNHDGYTIVFTLVDAGEPGTADQASFLIYETANPAHVVLDVPLQTLDGGNLQAHFDQPHQ
jgi:hypothetical protein